MNCKILNILSPLKEVCVHSSASSKITELLWEKECLHLHKLFYCLKKQNKDRIIISKKKKKKGGNIIWDFCAHLCVLKIGNERWVPDDIW